MASNYILYVLNSSAVSAQLLREIASMQQIFQAKLPHRLHVEVCTAPRMAELSAACSYNLRPVAMRTPQGQYISRDNIMGFLRDACARPPMREFGKAMSAYAQKPAVSAPHYSDPQLPMSLKQGSDAPDGAPQSAIATYSTPAIQGTGQSHAPPADFAGAPRQSYASTRDSETGTVIDRRTSGNAGAAVIRMPPKFAGSALDGVDSYFNSFGGTRISDSG